MSVSLQVALASNLLLPRPLYRVRGERIRLIQSCLLQILGFATPVHPGAEKIHGDRSCRGSVQALEAAGHGDRRCAVTGCDDLDRHAVRLASHEQRERSLMSEQLRRLAT